MAEASVVEAASQEGEMDGEANSEVVVTSRSELLKPLSQSLAPETPLLRDHGPSRLYQGRVSNFVEWERDDVAMASDPSWRVRSCCICAHEKAPQYTSQPTTCPFCR